MIYTILSHSCYHVVINTLVSGHGLKISNRMVQANGHFKECVESMLPTFILQISRSLFISRMYAAVSNTIGKESKMEAGEFVECVSQTTCFI